MIEGEHGRSATTEPIPLLTASDWAWRRRGPTAAAIAAFDVRETTLERIEGGQGFAWTDGRVVLKPVGLPAEHNWVCRVYAEWDAEEVRVPEPVAPRGDSQFGWSHDGWGAHVHVQGRDVELPHEAQLVKEASDAFHQCVRQYPRPDFLDLRDDPWALGDRIAWEGTKPYGDPETLDVINRLRDHLRPVSLTAQVIHGDILPNVLLSPTLPPAVIDWPPYYRPTGAANAIAATDAVTFHDAPLSLLQDWSTGESWNQLLVRALIYRLGTTGFFASRRSLMGLLVTHLERAKPVIEAVLNTS